VVLLDYQKEVNVMYTVILPAAGTGSRMNLGFNKLFHKIAKRTIIEHTVARFLNDIKCTQIIIVASADDQPAMQELFKDHCRVEFVSGAATRKESVYNALAHVREEVVMVHDGARPFVTSQVIDECYDVASKGFGAISAVTPKDTIKERHPVNTKFVKQTIDRNRLAITQTPQAFPTAVLKKANELAKNAFLLELATDDASLIEKHTEIEIKIVDGDYQNIKFTTPDDIAYFEFLLKKGWF
jgi:2-C-methyl-D-erythritol 4-phosphate cytidylyltransferase